MTSPLLSWRNVTSPTSARARELRGRPSAAPTAVETTPSMPERPRLAITLRRSPTAYGATIRSRSRIGLEAPTTSSPLGRDRPADGAGDLVRREPGLGGEQPVEPPGDLGVGGAPLREPVVAVVGPARQPGRPAAPEVELVVDRERALRPDAARLHRPDLDVVAAEQPGDRPRQRGVTGDHHPLDAAPEVGVEQQPVGADRVVPRAAPAVGSANSGQPGPAPAPAAAGPRRLLRRRRCGGRRSCCLGPNVQIPPPRAAVSAQSTYPRCPRRAPVPGPAPTGRPAPAGRRAAR